MNKKLGAALLVMAMAAACQQDPNKNSIVVFGINDGGTTADGGGPSGGVASGPIRGMALNTFNTGGEGFQLNQFDEARNLARHNNGTPPTLTFDSAQGNPDPGSLRVTAPYSGINQYVDVYRPFPTGMAQNWAGRTLRVRIRAVEGTFPGGVQLYVNTTADYAFGAFFTNFPAAAGTNWYEFTFNVSSPMSPAMGYDPTQVVQFGVQLDTGGAGAGAMPVVFNIDSFSIDPPLTGGGSDAGGGTDAGGTPADAGDGGAADAGIPAIDGATAEAASGG